MSSEKKDQGSLQPRDSGFENEVSTIVRYLGFDVGVKNTPPIGVLRSSLDRISNDKEKISQLALELSSNTPQDKKLRLFQVFEDCVSSSNEHENYFVSELVTQLISPLGLDYPSVLHDWQELSGALQVTKSRSEATSIALSRCLPPILSLEQKQEGSVKFFVENFKLNYFGLGLEDSELFLEWFNELTTIDTGDVSSYSERFNLIVRDFLQQREISDSEVGKMFQTWSDCSPVDSPFLTTAKNLESIKQLEKFDSEGDILKTLVYEFGIHNINRYHPQTLIRAYEQRHQKGDFGIVVYPKSDWNESFTQDSNVIESLSAQATEMNTSLKIVEVASLNEMVRLVGSSVREAQGKIQFMVLGGHGHIDQLRLGGRVNSPFREETRNVISITDIIRPETALFRKWFVENPSIALAACSTGGDGGLAEKLSEQMHADIHAPEIPTNIHKISLVRNGSRYGLDVIYDNEEGRFHKNESHRRRLDS